ncbi:Os06g0688500 [Oryza sativa Japonica Group]|uniref:Os06g0688500 protein n=1 Tax=Oryza sativa subsp. japonica TaxID=39947 RepID=C7J3S7_ORYSJ|nr:Os06g0688500 [Oryza sativa Japonica Group]|eukprot:NP_001174969.1 Os06g0688500 [Oryza sativa Japonica Group]
MEATSRASNTNNHPAATANEGMLSFSSAYVDDAAVHGETAVARPRQPTASPPPPAPGWRQPQRTHQAVAAITILSESRTRWSALLPSRSLRSCCSSYASSAVSRLSLPSTTVLPATAQRRRAPWPPVGTAHLLLLPLCSPSQCLSGTETLRWKRCDRLMRALRLSPSWAREAEEKLAAAGASNGCLPVDGRVVAANEKVRRRRRVVVGVADAGCGLHGTAAASRRRGAALLLSRLTR